MAQLRLDYPDFQGLDTQVIVAVPNGPKSIANFVIENSIPYPILADPGAANAERYGVKVRRLGLKGAFALFTPSVFLIDRSGILRYVRYEKSYVSEPDNQIPLRILKDTVPKRR